jgi:hypothetical protein
VYRYLPPVRWRIRAVMMDFRESFYDAVTDGDSDFANLIRTLCIDSMKAALPNGDSTGMWEKLTPDYNPGCKRVIIRVSRSDLTYLRSLKTSVLEITHGRHFRCADVVISSYYELMLTFL